MNMIRTMPTVESQSRELRIIGAAWGIGARDHRCAQGPAALAATRPLDQLKARGVRATWRDTIAVTEASDPFDAIADACRRVADAVEGTIRDGAVPVVVGGDHSSAIGTWSGARRALDGPLGMVWIDAHMDAHTPDTTPSGAIHGMPVACLLGRGDSRLTTLAGSGPALQPANLALIGIRSYESGEAALLADLGVRIYTMDEVRRRGLDVVLAEAVDRVGGTNMAGFGVSVDLDAVDPHGAPGVGSPVAGGFRGPDVVAALDWASRRANYVGCELAEFNPELDEGGRTARLIVDLLAAGAEG